MQPWKVLLGAGLAMAVLNLAVNSRYVDAAVYLSLAVTCVAAVVAVACRRRRPHPLAARLFAVGLTVFLAGDLLYYWSDFVYESESPEAAYLYLSSYPFLIAGAVVLIRRRGRGGSAAFIDTSIIAVGLGVLLWVFVMEPVLGGRAGDREQLVWATYPVVDTVLIAAAARLLVGGAARRPAEYLFGLGVAGLLVADSISGFFRLADADFDLGTALDLGWMAFYLFLSLSVLHPSARTEDDPGPWPEHPPTLVGARLPVMAGVCLLAPAVILYRHNRGDESSLAVLVGSSMVLFVLVVARMWVLTHDLTTTAARERSLHRGAASLATATDAGGIHTAAMDAARAVVERPDATLALLTPEGRSLRVVASDGPDAPPVGTLIDLGGAGIDRLSEVIGEALGGPLRARHVVTATMATTGGPGGVLAVGAASPFGSGVETALGTLGSQVALALESAALTADLLRRQGELRFRSLVQNSSDLIAVVDCDSSFSYRSPSVEHVLGASTSVVGARLLEFVHPDDVGATAAFLDGVSSRPGTSATMALRLRRTDGSWMNSETVGSNMLEDPSVNGMVLTIRDVTERRAFEEQLQHQALHDPLTGLANRVLFSDRVDNALAWRTTRGNSVGVVIIDLDDFKNVNDSLGHAAGDELLVTVATRISATVRPGDTTARLGGDEFALLLPDMPDRATAVDMAAVVASALAAPIPLRAGNAFLAASMGIAFADEAAIDDQALLRNAQVAMHWAKGRGKSRVEIFEPGMAVAAVNRLHLKADLQRALDEQEFVLNFQPIVSVSGQQVTGVEALVRWMSPTRGFVPPDEFIGLCEETGLIHQLGRWVLDDACMHARQWSFAERGLTMSVNLSAMELQRDGLAVQVKHSLDVAGIPASVITLEITESVLMRDIEGTAAVLRDLRELGVRLAIDDFGTGYSSLSYLRHLPIDVLKIDKEFVQGIEKGGEEALLVGTVIDLAHGLGLQTTAEGVELQEQFERLSGLGCDLAQGYLFSRPLDEGQLEAFLLPVDPEQRIDPTPTQPGS